MELKQASKQWADRPADQQFVDLDSLIAYTEGRRKASTERVVNMAALEFGTHNGELLVFDNAERELLQLTNWSFRQMARIVGAPSNYLPSLSPALARDCLNHNLRNPIVSESIHKAFMHKPSTRKDRVTLSAMTSETYGRVYDADVAHQVKMAIEGKSWITPPLINNQPTGLYTGDRDMFIFLINEEDKIEVGNARLARGFFVSNSEVGRATLTVTSFLYNYVCGNHIVFGAKNVREIKMFHRRFAMERFVTDVIPVIEALAHDATYETEIKDRVYAAMRMKLGEDHLGVIKFFKAKDFTLIEIRSAYSIGAVEGDDTTTLWGMIQGLTTLARTIPNMDRRNSLDRRAGALLSLVAVN